MGRTNRVAIKNLEKKATTFKKRKKRQKVQKKALSPPCHDIQKLPDDE
jgi:hypothetical protein